ncbi:LOW QUALITY PROTEIN: uncharacterized protein LOC108108052 [Drosophila eugracilis]|uniref:LOW QUALITY PROTEIN: uncharacterized protein LOC108108052 n=1 Tax=Drosophila eugracilis TaxID=29029 RepID=UPI001BD9EF1F|nr:LOW QUALITY PROTEIN: uncharacterized protein LOC108108052 [Drosophila eugracilis]
MLKNAVKRERPIYRDIQHLTDDQLSIMCQSHEIYVGPITYQNRRLAERQLHIAMIKERAKYRAQEQFAQEYSLEISENVQRVPPLQQHYGLVDALPQNHHQTMPPRTYWPSLNSNWRSPPPASTFIQNWRQRTEPVLEPRQYVSWRQENALANQRKRDAGTNILGFKIPFTLETAMNISSKISSTIKRFQGGGEISAKLEQEKKEMIQSSREDHKDEYLKRSDEDCDQEASHSSQHDLERDTLSDITEVKDHQPENDKEVPVQDAFVYPFPHDLQELQKLVVGAHDESQTELCDYASFISLSSAYHEFPNQVPMVRTDPSVKPKPRFHWWWQRSAAGNELIPEAEQTTELDLLQERELKTIHYLSEPPPRVDDGMLELMGRVELRDDSDDEEAVEVRNDGRRPRSYMGFCRHIFHLLCCDRHGRLDGEKLRCNFFCCCMAFGVYMGFKMLR